MPNALLYADQRQLELGETLGSGKDGIVLVAKRKTQPAKVAIKALRWPEAYERERNVYERLRGAGAVVILGFNVPQLVGSDDGLRVLEMTIVERPFVLDFAGAYLDKRPEFTEEIWAACLAARLTFFCKFPVHIRASCSQNYILNCILRRSAKQRAFGFWTLCRLQIGDTAD